MCHTRSTSVDNFDRYEGSSVTEKHCGYLIRLVLTETLSVKTV